MAKSPSMPKEIVDFAHWIEDTPKVAFSTTLDSVGWKNSRLVRVKADHDIAAEVRKLKQTPGGDMVVFGGARLAQTLAALDLIDEYRFKLEPVLLGNGYRLFQDVKGTAGLELTHSKVFKSGVMGLYYQRKR